MPFGRISSTSRSPLLARASASVGTLKARLRWSIERQAAVWPQGHRHAAGCALETVAGLRRGTHPIWCELTAGRAFAPANRKTTSEGQGLMAIRKLLGPLSAVAAIVALLAGSAGAQDTRSYIL